MRISLRWKLILISGSLAFATELALSAFLHIRARGELRQELENALERKCDEVSKVLEHGNPELTLEDFLLVETTSVASPTYFYEIRDARGRAFARSRNLGPAELPLPATWASAAGRGPVRFSTEPHPVPSERERILLRSERVGIAMPGRLPAPFVVQTAVELGPYEVRARRTLRDAVLVSAGGLAAVFFLLWFVTTRALRPVSTMTRKASLITATNLRERLPLAGTADELDELATVLNDMLDRLDGSLRQMEQFASGAAHQLRTPLTRIRGELDLILRGEVGDRVRSQLGKAQEELERLSRVCGRLLLLARLDRHAGVVNLLNERVDLQEVVAELLDQMAPVANDRGVRLRQGTTAPMVRVRGSRALLVEALLNLLDNAIRATPEGSLVEVSLEVDGYAVRLSVTDSGPGVPEAERERIFEPFYRLPRTSPGTADEGSGLGLAIVSAIARAHGGGVEVADAPAGGSIFRLLLPPTLIES